MRRAALCLVLLAVAIGATACGSSSPEAAPAHDVVLEAQPAPPSVEMRLAAALTRDYTGKDGSIEPISCVHVEDAQYRCAVKVVATGRTWVYEVAVSPDGRYVVRPPPLA